MASSSNSYVDTSDILDTVFKHIEEDKKRYEKLNLLIKSFQKADNEKTQIIQSLQDNPHLSSLEQDYLNLLRLQCVKDWENTSKCGELLSRIDLQLEEKQEFIERNKGLHAVNLFENNEQAIIPAESAEEFFFDGDKGRNEDDQYCKIAFLQDDVKCSRTFWGVLLGFTQDTALWEIHVDAWIRRSQLVHRHLIEKESVRTRTRYAVMPISFHEDFYDHHNWNKNFDLAHGYIKPYIRWKNVDSVLIPICCPNSYWFLIQYKLAENELTFYDRDKAATPAVYMRNLKSFYQKNILWFYNYIRHTRATAEPVPPPGSEPLIYLKNVKQYPGSKANSALFVCMWIHYLVTGEPSNVVTADVSDEQLVDFRKRMTTVLYDKRTM